MAEGAPLLREYAPKAHRGFESLRLRQPVDVVGVLCSSLQETYGQWCPEGLRCPESILNRPRKLDREGLGRFLNCRFRPDRLAYRQEQLCVSDETGHPLWRWLHASTLNCGGRAARHRAVLTAVIRMSVASMVTGLDHARSPAHTPAPTTDLRPVDGMTIPDQERALSFAASPGSEPSKNFTRQDHTSVQGIENKHLPFLA